MSNNNFITKLLNLKEENLFFSGEINKVTKNNITYNLIHAKLTYHPIACEVCGVINDNTSIIKYGYKSSDIKISPINSNPSILRLKKQRFLCKECNHTFTADTNIVDKHCYISKDVKNKILIDLRKKISEKDIAEINYVSPNTVTRAIDSNFESYNPKTDFLPENLLFDEFKSTKNIKGKMSFLYVNADTNEIIDIVENRQLYYLENYFSRFSLSARKNVKTVCIDMYAPYISLIKKVFPNAEIIMDKFHIVQLLTRAFNKTRISIMSKFKTNSFEYKRLKKYWRFFLKNKDDVDYIKFDNFTHFKSFQSEKTLIYNSLNVDDTLKNCYEVLHDTLYYLKKKDKDMLYKHLEDSLNTDISSYFKTAIKSLIKHFKYIENTMSFDFTNGAIEGINNYIKVLKRIAFGYKNFFHFRNRILITRALVIPIIKDRVA